MPRLSSRVAVQGGTLTPCSRPRNQEAVMGGGFARRQELWLNLAVMELTVVWWL